MWRKRILKALESKCGDFVVDTGLNREPCFCFVFPQKGSNVVRFLFADVWQHCFELFVVGSVKMMEGQRG